MLDFLLWVVAVELLGLAAMPLAVALLPRLADRGYGLAKVLGVLLVTYVNYLLGSVLGLGNNVPLLAAGMLVAAAAGVFVLGRDRAAVASWLRAHRAAVALEEIIFLALFAAWTLFRAAHPGILSTEKPMDLALMTASHKAASFPPYDPWLAGTTINYYYGGYLAAGTLVTLTGVAPAVGFNLAVALLFALVGSAAYSVAYDLMRDARWALLGTAFVLLCGNLDGLGQLLDPAHGTAYFDFFRGSRIVEPTNCGGGACTITEFPAFSYLLGDLHPHVIALPFTILAIGVALNLALAPAAGWVGLGSSGPRRGLTLGLAGLTTGALYFMNSWDWPTYVLLCGAALLVPGLRSLSRRSVGEAVALAVGVLALGYVLFFSFHLDFKPQYSSFGLLPHGSPTGQVLTMFGLFLLPVAAVVIAGLARRERADHDDAAPLPVMAAGATPAAVAGARSADEVAGAAARRSKSGSAAVLEREPDEDDDDLPELPRLPTLGLPRLGGRPPTGLSVFIGTGVVLWILFSAGGLATVGLLLPFALAALYLAWREGRDGHADHAFALLLCAGGIGLIMLCDVLYLKDIFCGALDPTGNCTGSLYRMNTVFKFYYQAWTVLALGAAYGLFYLATRSRVGRARFVAPAAAMALSLAGGIYLILGVFTPTTNIYTTPVANAAATLDGSAYLDSYRGGPGSVIPDAIPADAAAIRWLNANVSGHPTILEADQVADAAGRLVPQDYWPYPGYPTQALMMSRISTFTGLPAVLGSGYSHEGLWHGDAVVATRFADVHKMFTSTDPAVIGALLHLYNVGYVYLGQVEAYTYYAGNPARVAAALARFKRFGTVAYSAGGVTIIRVSQRAG